MRSQSSETVASTHERPLPTAAPKPLPGRICTLVEHRQMHYALWQFSNMQWLIKNWKSTCLPILASFSLTGFAADQPRLRPGTNDSEMMLVPSAPFLMGSTDGKMDEQP